MKRESRQRCHHHREIMSFAVALPPAYSVNRLNPAPSLSPAIDTYPTTYLSCRPLTHSPICTRAYARIHLRAHPLTHLHTRSLRLTTMSNTVPRPISVANRSAWRDGQKPMYGFSRLFAAPPPPPTHQHTHTTPSRLRPSRPLSALPSPRGTHSATHSHTQSVSHSLTHSVTQSIIH